MGLSATPCRGRAALGDHIVPARRSGGHEVPKRLIFVGTTTPCSTSGTAKQRPFRNRRAGARVGTGVLDMKGGPSRDDLRDARAPGGAPPPPGPRRPFSSGSSPNREQRSRKHIKESSEGGDQRTRRDGRQRGNPIEPARQGRRGTSWRARSRHVSPGEPRQASHAGLQPDDWARGAIWERAQKRWRRLTRWTTSKKKTG